jgi:hypothetical protein
MKHYTAKVSALAVLGICLIAAGPVPLHAQKKGEAPKGGLGQAAPPPKALPPGVTKPEFDDYKALYSTHDDGKIIMLGEAFIMKYPMSMYLFGVYSQLTSAYLHTNQTDKMFDVGNKALAINPDSIDVLPVLAWSIPRGVTSKTPDGPAQLAKAQTYAHHAIELLNAMAKPDGLDDASFAKAKNEDLSLCYSGLGTADMKLGKYPEAVDDLNKAVTLTASPDDVDLYLLGLADQQTNHFTAGIKAYTQCAANPGPMQAGCKSGIDETKKKAQNSIEAPE